MPSATIARHRSSADRASRRDPGTRSARSGGTRRSSFCRRREHVDGPRTRPCRARFGRQPQDQPRKRALSEPLSPTSASVSPRCDVEIDPIDGREPARRPAEHIARHGEALGQPLTRTQRRQTAKGVGLKQRSSWYRRALEGGGGCSGSQAALRLGQRGAKRQAIGTSPSSGTRPGITVSSLRHSPRSPACCATGPACTGARVAERSARGGPALDDLARVHHGHAVADLVHDAEVVGDQDHAHPELARQLERSARGSAPGSSRRARSSARRRSAASAPCTSAIAIITRWRIPPENWCG